RQVTSAQSILPSPLSSTPLSQISGKQTALLFGSKVPGQSNAALQDPKAEQKSHEAAVASTQSISTTPQPQSQRPSPYHSGSHLHAIGKGQLAVPRHSWSRQSILPSPSSSTALSQISGGVQVALLLGSIFPGQPTSVLQDPGSSQYSHELTVALRQSEST